MRIVCLGGGPAGLYFATLIKQANPAHDVLVVERSQPDDTYGWGVVFSDLTLDSLRNADPDTHRRILNGLVHWDDIEIHYRNTCIRSGGHGFAGIGRAKLLEILQDRARELGVELRFNTPADTPSDYPNADLIVAADGIHSAVRNADVEVFQPDIQIGDCRYLWLGSDQELDAFTFDFRETEWGWFSLHAYRYAADASTYIVEAPEPVWLAAGLDKADAKTSIEFCENLFRERLGGHHLQLKSGHPRGGEWLRFNRLVCRRWYKDNVVLLGDAAHTAHFSIGSGTKLAMEDAIALAEAIAAEPHVPTALARYQAEREPAVQRIQSAARNRQEWFEHVDRYTGMDPIQFSYTLLTGSQRLGHDNLKLRDPAYVGIVEADLSRRAGLDALMPPVPPIFTPFTLGNLKFANRVVVPPMATYSATDGLPNDFHLTHLGSRALGGAGLVMTEMTAPVANGRITPNCTGLWNDVQEAGWKRIVDFVHAQSDAKIGLQLGHAGPKGATCPPWEGTDQPLVEYAWPLLAPSALPWRPYSAVPSAMNEADMAQITASFVASAERALRAGFDLLELHCAHGYLLSAFLTPLWNQRTDQYGSSLKNRLRFPLQVFAAIRKVWPKPLLVRISAHDWMPKESGGNTGDDAVAIAAAFKQAGADMIHVSSGQTHPAASPVYGRMYQTPFSDRIRNEVGIPTIAVGNITLADQVNTIIAAGRADLCALGRPHLADPHWTLHAAAEQGFAMAWPRPYVAGRDQLLRQAAQEASKAP
ncbi:MAG TPA: bifunctional salicylyl-CoA 5-hydroxylase/oxidoreductase [Rhodocyclaceae bacterium]|nr:bifunctional salicylyl-CoA 5-hydroxylase/oxidoreductase [Rhodocyclaceae bacterium]